jgi:hypothetical protein
MISLQITETSVKILAAALSLVTVGLFASFAAGGQSQTVEQSKLSIEIQSGDRGPRFTLTNLSAKTLTACFLQISSSSENEKSSGMDWDAPLLGQQPLEPGASISLSLPHRPGGPVPDKVEVAAAVWADGETEGREDLVKLILANRVMRESEYDQAVSLLQQGLEQNWDADQYLAASSGRTETELNNMIRSNLEANQNLNAKPQVLRQVIQNLLKYCTQKREILRQAKPHQGVTTGQ